MPHINQPKKTPAAVKIAVGGGLILALFGTGAWVAFSLYQANQAKKQETTYNAAVTQASSLTASRQYSQAQSVLTNYLATKPPAKYRGNIDSVMGEIFVNEGRPADALVWFKREEADMGSLDLHTATEAVLASHLSGDKTDELHYLQETLKLREAENAPDSATQIKIVQAQIAELKGTP